MEQQVIDKISRLELLRKAPPEVQDLYGNVDLGLKLKTLATDLSINDELTYETFALTIGDVILGLYKKQSLAQLLKDRLGLDEQKASIVTTALKDFIDHIPESNSAQEYIPQPVQITPAKPLNTLPENANLSQAHSYGAFRSPQPSGDDPDEPTYTSNQSDIINR